MIVVSRYRCRPIRHRCQPVTLPEMRCYSENNHNNHYEWSIGRQQTAAVQSVTSAHHSATSATVASEHSTIVPGSMGNTACGVPAAAQTVSNWVSVSST